MITISPLSIASWPPSSAWPFASSVFHWLEHHVARGRLYMDHPGAVQFANGAANLPHKTDEGGLLGKRRSSAGISMFRLPRSHSFMHTLNG